MQQSIIRVGGRVCGLIRDGLSCVWEVYSTVVNDKYGGGGGGIDHVLWLEPANGK